MVGGNSHQRAIQKATAARIEKQVATTVAEYLGRPSVVTPPIKAKTSLLRSIIGWDGLSFVTLFGGGLAFLTIPHGYPASRACFIGAAIAFTLKVTFSVDAAAPARMIIAALMAIVAGLGVNRLNDWVTSLEVEEASKVQVRTVVIREAIPPKHLYDLSGDKEEKLKKALQVHKGAREIIRVGCTSWSEESCVAVGKFLIVFSEAGWTIDSKQVFRMTPQIPTEGVSIVSNDTKVENAAKHLPPHLGVWHKASSSEVTFFWAFKGMDIPVSSASDLSLPPGTLGIYFGPEPQR